MFELTLDNRSPIYEQLIEHIKEMIIKQVLTPDEKMPSVRELARELTINPNTIQKAYRELEQQGYIYSVPAKGSYVNDVSGMRNEVYLKELYENLEQVISELLYMNEDKSTIINKVRQIDDALRRGHDDEHTST